MQICQIFTSVSIEENWWVRKKWEGRSNMCPTAQLPRIEHWCLILKIQHQHLGLEIPSGWNHTCRFCYSFMSQSQNGSRKKEKYKKDWYCTSSLFCMHSSDTQKTALKIAIKTSCVIQVFKYNIIFWFTYW